MAVLDRLFGIVDDATAGGKDYDALSAGAIPDSSVFYPVTGGNFDPAIERIDRNDEVRGRRANVPPRPFRAAPTMTIPMSAYPKAIEKLTYKLLGAKDTTGGGPYTHTMRAIGYPNVNLPACHCQMVRDSLNIKMSGATVNQIVYDFPLDGEGTMEVQFFGKYFNHFDAASPTPSYPDYGATVDTLMLRDASFYIDGSATKVSDLQGFQLTFANALTRKWYAGRNVVRRDVGSTGTQYKKLWFPAENKAQAAPEITYSLTFGSTNQLQEIAMWYSQIQYFEFNIVGLPLDAYPGTDFEMNVIIYNSVETGGGASDLSAREDIVSTYEGGVFFSEGWGKDLEISFTTDTATVT